VKKTVFILTSERPDGLGGLEHFVRELNQGLNTKGYSTEIFHRGNSEPAWLAKRTGRWGKKLTRTLLGYWVGRNAQRNMTEDVVAVISNSDVGFYPLRHSTPFRKIHFYHGTYRGQCEAIRPLIKYGGYLYLKWWNSMVLERLSGRGKVVLAGSEQTCDEVSRYFGYHPIVMWHPIDTQRFKPGDAVASRAALKLPEKGPIGLFVGSIHPVKGFPLVRSLIDGLPEVHWVLALRGDLPEDGFARSNLTILHDVPHDQIPLLYNAADFSVCPSLYESFGYVVAESLACGTPVLASPGGASRLFLQEPPFDRFLIPGRDAANGFLTAARQVLRDPGFYRRAVIEQIRPKLLELMSPENWWQRFFEVTKL
jgi:glycosyltransferase involved in cell wall biosynthesis